MDGAKNKLCPFSLPLALPAQQKISALTGRPVASVKIGLPCIGPDCKWFSYVVKDCIVFEFLMYLTELVNKKANG